MKRILTLSFLMGMFLLTVAGDINAQRNKHVVLGDERMDTIRVLLKDKRIALAVNQTSILENSHVHLLDTLVAQKFKVSKIFAPEHGFRGTEDAGAKVEDGKDAKTGIPIISLYGKNNKPTAEQLKDIDVVVFDIQDVGTRFFTYISTMHYLMEACAQNGKEFIVLDRPNPNDYVDGPVRKPAYKSFVGMHPIPVLHGLTIGELAQMINGEGWLQSTPKKCKLTVVKLLNWQHGDAYQLPVKPSPNLPNDQAIRLYPSLCFFEGTCMSIGRGTQFPFQVIGHTYPKMGKFTFTPTAIPGMDSDPLYKDKPCHGDDLRKYPFEGGLSMKFIIDFFIRTGRNEKIFFTKSKWFDQIAGTNVLREQILAGLTDEEIHATWQYDLENYKTMRKKYLLYVDYTQSK